MLEDDDEFFGSFCLIHEAAGQHVTARLLHMEQGPVCIECFFALVNLDLKLHLLEFQALHREAQMKPRKSWSEVAREAAERSGLSLSEINRRKGQAGGLAAAAKRRERAQERKRS